MRCTPCVRNICTDKYKNKSAYPEKDCQAIEKTFADIDE